MNKTVVTYADPKSAISEAFRNMRTNITFSDIDKELKVLAVTSTDKSEGKTTIFSNYAVALAQSGKRVLLIDCDLRRPQVHRKFSLNNDVGLTNILLKEISIEEGMQKTKMENLLIIASGSIPPNPSEILASQQMKEVVKKLKEDFDYILLDAPPVGMVTDAAVLKPVVGGYIVVVSLGSSHREGLRYVIETLHNIKAHIIGVVVNKVPILKSQGYYAYYGAYEDEREPHSRKKPKALNKDKKK